MNLFTFFRVLCLGLVVSSLSLTAHSATRGPYLQNATKNSVTIHWRTSSAHQGIVKYGTSAANLNLTATESSSQTKHVLTIKGLAQNTKYYYQIGNATGSVFETPANQAEQFFKANSTTPKATRIWVLGDPGTGTSNQLAVRDAYYALTASENKETDLVLALGDNAYGNGTDSQYGNNFFDTYQAMFQKAPVWSTQGNHERNMDVYLDVFSHPTNAEGGGIASGSELYYSFNYGDIHFVCLDSYGSAINNTAGAPQFQWLAQDLAANTKKWVIAFWHHPPYSYTSSHNADTERDLVRMRENAVEVLEKAGVDLVLSGHNHHYDRTQFINGHYGKSSTFNAATHVVQAGDGNANAYAKSDNRGATYVMTGSAGKNNTYSIINKPVTQVAFDRLGSFIIDLNADNTELTMRILRNNGNVDDTFRINKKPLGNTAPTVNAGVDGNVQMPNPFTVNGVVADDGFVGYPLSLTWSQVAGPAGGASFANAAMQNTQVSFGVAGTYTLRLTANDGEFTSSDDIAVTVAPAPSNTAPIANAGADVNVTLSNTLNLMGSVSDDSFAGFPVTASWSQASGPVGGATFTNANAITSGVKFSSVGTYTLRLTANDSQFSDSDDIVVEVQADPINEAPVVDAGDDQQVIIFSDSASITLNGKVNDDNFPGTNLSVSWKSSSADVSFENANALNTQVTFPVSTNNITFTLTADDGEFSRSDSLLASVVNSAPVARDDFKDTAADTAVSIDVLANDSDPNTQAVKLDSVSPALHGQTMITDGKVLYTPEKGYIGADTFTYQISDGLGATATAKVTLSVGATDVEIGDVSSTGGDRSTYTFDHSVAGKERLLIVSIYCDSGKADADVSYGGAAMALVASKLNSQGKPGIATYQQIAPAVGTAAVSASLQGSSDKCLVGAITLTGVDQTEPLSHVIHATGSSATTNISVKSQSHDLVLELAASIASGKPTSESGQINHFALEMGGSGSSDHYAVMASKVSEQNIDVGMSHTYPENKEWLSLGLNINASGGSTTTPIAGVSVDTSDANASEAGLEPGVYTLSRTGDPSLPLRIDYTVSGTASAGEDYQSLSGIATISSGLSSVDVVVTPIDDSVDEPVETIILTLQTSSDYVISSRKEATITLTSDDSLRNTAPIPDAGSDGSVQLPNTYTLNATISDDAFEGFPVVVTWSQASGPENGVSFANANSLTSNVTFTLPGDYTLRIIANDGEFSATDVVKISVSPASINKAPVANAGPDGSVALAELFSLKGSVADDSFAGNPLQNTWSHVSGPAGGTTFTDANQPKTTASFSVAGTYVLRLTASDGEFNHTDEVTVTVTDTALNAVDDSAKTDVNKAININVLANDSAAGTLSVTINAVSKPLHGIADIIAGRILYTPEKDYEGTDNFTYTISDGKGGSATANVNVTVSKATTGGAGGIGFILFLMLVAHGRRVAQYLIRREV